MSINQKLCGHCHHFIGGGDFGLCCSKRYELCYAETEWPDCEFYEYDENQKWLMQCPLCGKYATYYFPFGKKYLSTSDYGDLLLKRYWHCKDCDATVAIEVGLEDGNEYIIESELDK